MHRLFGQEAAGVQLGGDPRYPEHFLELGDAVDHLLGAAENHAGLQQVFIGGVGQLFVAGLPPLGDFHAGPAQGILEQLPLPPEERFDAVPGFLDGLGLAGRDVHGDAHVDVAAVARVPRRLPLRLVVLEVVLQVFHVHGAQAEEDGVTQPADAPETVLAAGGDADLGMRLLVGQGRQRGVGDGVVLALVGEGFALPGQQDDVQRLLEAFPAFAVVDAHDVVGPHVAAAADAELETAFAELVDGGRFLGDAQGMDQRQHLDRHADAEPLGAGRNGGGDDYRRGQHGAVGVEVHLAQPHGIQSQLFGQVDFLKGFLECVGVGGVAADVEVRVDSEVHLCTSFVAGSVCAEKRAQDPLPV